jgi:hypothetical protein
MKQIRPIFGILAGALAALALLAPSALASPGPRWHGPDHHDHGHAPWWHGGGDGHGGPAGAVFVQTDNVAGNSVVAYERSAQGTLTQAGVYPTGGLGGELEGSKVDHLASQGSLALDREAGLLFAVNAGSNTITEFAVHGTALSRIATVPSGGQFPVSVTVHGDSLFVLNALGGGSIQGYRLFGAFPVPIHAWNRPLGLDPSATPAFTHTPGQVAFTPSGSQLVVTTKANTNAVDVFGIYPDGAPSWTPTVTTLPEAVPFAVDFDAAGHLLVAEAGPNALASFSIGHNGSLSQIASAPTGQEATCWIANVGSTFYLSNAAPGSVSAFAENGSSLTPLGNTATSGGTVDAAAAGQFLYVQTGAEGVIDEFAVGAGGTLTSLGSVTVPGAVGGEGIAAA